MRKIWPLERRGSALEINKQLYKPSPSFSSMKATGEEKNRGASGCYSFTWKDEDTWVGKEVVQAQPSEEAAKTEYSEEAALMGREKMHPTDGRRRKDNVEPRLTGRTEVEGSNRASP